MTDQKRRKLVELKVNAGKLARAYLSFKPYASTRVHFSTYSDRIELWRKDGDGVVLWCLPAVCSGATSFGILAGDTRFMAMLTQPESAELVLNLTKNGVGLAGTKDRIEVEDGEARPSFPTDTTAEIPENEYNRILDDVVPFSDTILYPEVYIVNVGSRTYAVATGTYQMAALPLSIRATADVAIHRSAMIESKLGTGKAIILSDSTRTAILRGELISCRSVRKDIPRIWSILSRRVTAEFQFKHPGRLKRWLNSFPQRSHHVFQMTGDRLKVYWFSEPSKIDLVEQFPASGDPTMFIVPGTQVVDALEHTHASVVRCRIREDRSVSFVGRFKIEHLISLVRPQEIIEYKKLLKRIIKKIKEKSVADSTNSEDDR